MTWKKVSFRESRPGTKPEAVGEKEDRPFGRGKC